MATTSVVAPSPPARRFDTTDLGTCSFFFYLDGLFGLEVGLGFFEGGVIVYFVGNFFDTLRLWLACAQSMAFVALDVSMALCSHWHLCCLGTLRAVPAPPLVMGIFFRLPSALPIDVQSYGHGHDCADHGHRCLHPLRSPLHSLQWRRLWHAVSDVAGIGLLTLQMSSPNRP